MDRINPGSGNDHQGTNGFLVEEYQATQEFALQADTIAWQISSILISAIVVATGFLLKSQKSILVFYVGILFVIVLLSFWLLFFFGQYQVKLMKLYRVREIEERLGFKQNLYWDLGRKKNKHHGIYRTFGPGGVFLVKILFSILSGFIIGFGFFKFINLFETFSILEKILIIETIRICLFISVLSLVTCIEKKKELDQYLEKNPGKFNSQLFS